MILANNPGDVEGEEGGGGAILKTSSAQGTTHSQFHNAYLLLMANNGYNSLRRLYNSVFYFISIRIFEKARSLQLQF